MRAISFAWTTPALLAGEKTVTRRDWKWEYAQRFKVGQLVVALDKDRRAGGKQIATIQITREPYRESTAMMTAQDYQREGFTYLAAHGHRDVVERIIRNWTAFAEEVWVIEFRVVEVSAV